MRYLDIDKTIKAFEEQHGSESTLLNCYNADWIVSFRESQQTADVQEVRHGKCISKPDGFACSECKKKAGTAYGKVGAYLSKYCPNCGAKMDGRE